MDSLRPIGAGLLCEYPFVRVGVGLGVDLGVGLGVGVGVGVGVGAGVGLGVGVGDGAQAVIRIRAVNASANKQRLQCRILIFNPSLATILLSDPC
jgi:hypothetical protein